MRLQLSRALLVASFALAAPAGPLVAQQRDSTRAPARDSVARDSAARDSAGARSRRASRPRRGGPATSTIPDSLLRPPISARRAFLYSLVLPGQGQIKLRRHKAAALFGSIELGSIFMLLKSQNDLRIARAHVGDSVFLRFDPPTTVGGDSVPVYRQDILAARVKSRRLHVEDWVAALVFNHLFAGADAFVAAQLWDLPAQVSLRAAPRGLAVNASVSW